MTWTAVAIGGGALLGGIISSQGAQSAASTQAGAQEQAAQIGQNEFNTITAQEQPFMQGGYGALGQLDYLLGIPSAQGSAPGMSTTQPVWGGGFGGFGGGGGRFGAEGFRGGGPIPPTGIAGSGSTSSTGGGFGSLLQPFTADTMRQYSPAYGFQLQQGAQAVLNGDSSGAGAESGAATKDLINYNQSAANEAFNNAFNQYQVQQGNIYQRLAGMTQLGQAAAANTGQQGSALAANIGQSVASAGAARAAGQVGSANAWSGALSGASYVPWLMANSGGPVVDASAGTGGFG